MRRLLSAALLFATSTSLADSPQLLIFKSAKLRAMEGLSRQKSRDTLARTMFGRVEWLRARGAASQEEYEIAAAAARLAALDLTLAESRAKHASLSLEVALALEERGRKVPICRRKKQTDDDKTSPLRKQLIARRPLPQMSFEPFSTGTKVKLPDPEPPQPPDPPRPPDPGEPPPVGPPSPPGNDPPEAPEPQKPKPEKPTPPKPKPGGG